MSNWADYEPYAPPYRGPLSDLSRKEARASFTSLMPKIETRREQLQRLIGAVDVLGTDDESVQKLDGWFRLNMELNDDGVVVGMKQPVHFGSVAAR